MMLYMAAQTQVKVRIGVVNFFNATPLIEGISTIEGVELVPKVPSELVGCLERDEVDIALASSIDYQRCDITLGIIPVGVLSSDGESLTVKLCSRIPFEKITEVHCDSDSHTSVALLQIIMKEVFGIEPKLVDSDIRSLCTCNSEWPETVLIIGDKVITSGCDTEYEYSLDLGKAWKEQYSLPFVFATWFAREDIACSTLEFASVILTRQLACNAQRIEQVVSSNASGRGWPAELALDYVTKHMYYKCTPSHIESLQLFYELSKKHGVLNEIQPIRLLTI
jgi:chorismate dehydratase